MLSSFPASGLSTSFFSSRTSGSASVSLRSFLDTEVLFLFGCSLSIGGDALAFSLILADLLGVSPVPQSNSAAAGPPGCAFRY
ncbi:hypothetical protein IC582_011889 [Cucumis melo]